MISLLLNEPYIELDFFSFLESSRRIDQKHTQTIRSVALVIQEMNRKVIEETGIFVNINGQMKSDTESVISYITSSLEEIEHYLLNSLYWIKLVEDDLRHIKIDIFEDWSFQDKIAMLGIPEYGTDRNVGRLFKLDAKMYKEYCDRMFKKGSK